MRLLSSLQHYFVTRSDDGVQIQQYASCTVVTNVKGGDVRLQMQTSYPWQGALRLSVERTPAAPWRLAFRIPAWCARPALVVNGEDVAASVDAHGYLSSARAWRAGDVVDLDLPMAPRLIASHPRIDATRACVAIERGPLVYCLESPDQPRCEPDGRSNCSRCGDGRRVGGQAWRRHGDQLFWPGCGQRGLGR